MTVLHAQSSQLTPVVPASSSKTPDALFSALNTSGLPNTADAHHFIKEVFDRAPRRRRHKRSVEDTQKPAGKESKTLRLQKFDFLLDNEADGNDAAELHERKQEHASTKSKHDRHIRRRERDGNDWESDEERKSSKRRRGEEEVVVHAENVTMESPEDERARVERERLKDLEDRDAFAERMRNRDKERTKKLVDDRTSKIAGEIAEASQRRQLADDPEARDHALPSLRQHSRQEYLTKREIQQIELLRKEIADDATLFHGMKVSRREKRELERKKELLKLVEERLNINDKWDGYQLPEDYLTEKGKIDKKKKDGVLYQRYEEAKSNDDHFITDVDQWEASQAQHSSFRTGTTDKQEIVDDYDYVFDESQAIQFVMDTTTEDNVRLTASEKLLQSQIDAAEKHGKSQ